MFLIKTLNIYEVASYNVHMFFEKHLCNDNVSTTYFANSSFATTAIIKMIDQKFHTVKRVAQNLRFTRNLNYIRRNLGITEMFLCVHN